VLEDPSQEKLNPQDKAWQIVRYCRHQTQFGSQQVIFLMKGKGHKIRIGDTIKFGRVRFKVIMMQNEVEGEMCINLKKL